MAVVAVVAVVVEERSHSNAIAPYRSSWKYSFLIFPRNFKNLERMRLAVKDNNLNVLIQHFPRSTLACFLLLKRIPSLPAP